MNTIFSRIYHHLPERCKRYIRLWSYSYNDVIDGHHSLFRNRIEREINRFLTEDELIDKGKVRAIRKDIKHCWIKFGASPEEYFLFGFRTLSDDKRAKFITDYEKDMTLKKKMGLEIFAEELLDKYRFYTLTMPFFKRQAFKFTDSTTESEFIEFAVSSKKLFVKPMTLSRGRGAYKVHITTIEDAKKEYSALKDTQLVWMIEEEIEQSDEMKRWNASSVNTVRIPTFLNKDGFFIGVPFFRTGRAGSCVDNAGGGGVFCNVNPKTGVIYTDGMDESGHLYKTHPDSGMVFNGFQIPNWVGLLQTVEKVHRECMSHHIYIGWDFALTNDGWVLLEGNWGQFISQYADKDGFRDRFMNYINSGFYKKN